MWQYIKLETKRLFHTLPGFFLSLAGTVLFIFLIVILAENFLPKVLEVKPFRIGLCVEGNDRMSDYVRDYILQMESTKDLVEFQEMSQQEIQEALQKSVLTAGIVIPEKTVESVMDGSNTPIRVLMGANADNTEQYLQERLIRSLIECGAVLIDVPQAETLLLYEMQAENPKELGTVLDLFHFGLVLERESWFEEVEISVFGNADAEEYYLASALTLFLIFWGLGSGSFFREQEKSLPLLLGRKGISFFCQAGIKQSLYILWYLVPVLLLSIGSKNGDAIIPGFFCAAMLALQCSFFFQLAPTPAGGIVLSVVWGLAGFFGAGGILPTVFLPKTLTQVCGVLPAGICMEVLLRLTTEKRGTGWRAAGITILWCLLFGLGGQLIFYTRQRSKMRR
ncbi:ABC transporter permease [Lachnospiraceae bacterium 38-10]